MARSYGMHPAAFALAVLAAIAIAVGVAAPAARAQQPFDPTAPGGPGLVTGITEPNPAFLWPAAERELPEPFAAWRTELAAVHPWLYRLVLDWPQLQPSADRPPDLAAEQSGCARGVPPCLAWRGVREQLAALAAAQRSDPGLQALVTVTGTPAWAVSPRGDGCFRPADPERSRAPRDDALPAYRALVRAVLRAARRAGATLRYWSAWNEPNHPYFLSPQRATCDVASPTLAVGAYLELVRALDVALARAPGDQQSLLGELAGSVNGSTVSTGAREFIAALPLDVLCASPVWLEHAYNNGATTVDAVTAALDARGCPRPHAIWLTETGLGISRAGDTTTPAPHDRPGACARWNGILAHWYENPRVTVAAQYTFREDPLFRIGLVTAGLDHAYRTLRAWQAWGARPDPTAPPPTAEQACGAMP